MDQIDLGLLVRNIAHSLTDQRRGTIKISEQDCCLLIEVLVVDHYLSGVLTLYRFSIDKMRWLPAGVEEFTPDGIIKRKGIILNLRTPIALPDDFFRIDRGESSHGRPEKYRHCQQGKRMVRAQFGQAIFRTFISPMYLP